MSSKRTKVQGFRGISLFQWAFVRAKIGTSKSGLDAAAPDLGADGTSALPASLNRRKGLDAKSMLDFWAGTIN